ncbi:hypothetical protein Cpin_5717 [Chitinophaga pinensis DSM 2588]|uniref:Uncharacterized protein n=1 Tax=Chitinophaga pinensis (strain ATCC 43595 / DSM 2588 / LMG 13176 / NBRC 15968 / NCIMB 11800 / UQM 2034) TaxID=485918 RepID=A0A979GYE3_CHIPD|nr:hypothetical protein Cpin_5717 [Chitinophaga pinensis DSM 2588]
MLGPGKRMPENVLQIEDQRSYIRIIEAFNGIKKTPQDILRCLTIALFYDL